MWASGPCPQISFFPSVLLVVIITSGPQSVALGRAVQPHLEIVSSAESHAPPVTY